MIENFVWRWVLKKECYKMAGSALELVIEGMMNIDRKIYLTKVHMFQNLVQELRKLSDVREF